MKSSHPRITLLGNNSGRNLGDAAIMSSILEMLSEELPGAEFYVPSIKPSFIDEHYGKKYKVHGVDVMPWTGSIRLLGIPTLRCMAKSDVALICDGIIFGKKLFNPAFNFLITLVFLAPFCKLLGCKLVCFSCGIGPFPSFWSRLFAKWVIDACDLVIMREHDSESLAREIGVTKPITVTGDAAFVNPVSSAERGVEICEAEGIDLSLPIFGVNVTKYVDSWLKDSERVGNRGDFMETLALGIEQAKSAVNSPFQLVLFCTQPMDESFVRGFANRVNGKVIANSKYLSHDIQAVMRRCELLMGMRFHSLVLASAVEVPIIGLVYAPKVRGYMRLLDCEDMSLELSALTPTKLSEVIVKSWNDRSMLKQKQMKVVQELKTGARNAAAQLRQTVYPELELRSRTLESTQPRAASMP